MSDIFEVVNDDDHVTIPEDVDYYTELVGEGKKFKTERDLARGKAEADTYIELLKKKNDELLKELNTRTSLDAFLDKMKTKEEPPVTETTTPQGGDNRALDDSEIEQRILKALEQREAAKAQETNIEKVTRVMNEQFGDQANLVINKRSKELGMPAADLKAMAARSPSAFFTLVGVSETSAPGLAPAIPRSGFNNQGSSTPAGIRNKAFFEKLKVQDPKKYFDPKTTTEMMKAMAECRKHGVAWE